MWKNLWKTEEENEKKRPRRAAFLTVLGKIVSVMSLAGDEREEPHLAFMASL